MKVISLVPNDIGQYSAPMNTDAMFVLGDNQAWWPDSLDMTEFNANNGCVNLVVARKTVKSYSVNSEALESYNQKVLAIATNMKIMDMAATCQAMIYNGADVELSTGTEHFSFTSNDQLNIDAMFDAVKMGATEYPYHQDGGKCMIYSAEDIFKIYVASKSTVTYHTTYNNSIKQWITRETDLDTINGIYYGIELPSDLKAEFDSLIAQSKQIMDDLIAKLTSQLSLSAEDAEAATT